MRKHLILLIVNMSVISSCANNAAIFVENQQIGLGIHSAPESNTPAELIVGYDRQIFTKVPKRTGRKFPGESTSLVSSTDIRINADPNIKGTTKEVLMVDATFISGPAAIIAAMPSGATIRIGSVTMETRGEDRLRTAFEPSFRKRAEMLNKAADKVKNASLCDFYEEEKTILIRNGLNEIEAGREAFRSAMRRTIYSATDPIETDKQIWEAIKEIYMPPDVRDFLKAIE